MSYLKSIGAIALAAALSMTLFEAQAFDDAKYPNLKGRWNRFVVRGVTGQPSFDQTKPWGLGQEAPLTPEYQAVLEASIADQAKGGQGNFRDSAGCHANGMPLMMQAFQPMEFVVTPEITYVLINNRDHGRRIYTDGRDWPKVIQPTFQGYSIGRWVEEVGGSRYDALEVETRGPFKGPRVYDATGIPLHSDNQSLFKERIQTDQADSNVLHDEITVIDHALTRPWIVDKRYVRSPDARPDWPEAVCDYNAQINIGRQDYFLSADGLLMPTKKDQPPPDTRYFNQTRK